MHHLGILAASAIGWMKKSSCLRGSCRCGPQATVIGLVEMDKSGEYLRGVGQSGRGALPSSISSEEVAGNERKKKKDLKRRRKKIKRVKQGT